MKDTILRFPEQNIFVLGAHNHPEWFMHISPGMNYQLQGTESVDTSNERKDVLQRHVHEVYILHGNTGIFRRRNIWSALYYLFANANLFHVNESHRPAQLHDRERVCEQRHYVDDYVLKAAKSFDMMEEVDGKWRLKFQFPASASMSN